MKHDDLMSLKAKMSIAKDFVQEAYEMFDTSESKCWSEGLETLLEDIEDLTKAIKYCFTDEKERG